MLRAQIPEGFYKLELNEQFMGKGKLIGKEVLVPYLKDTFEFYLKPDMIQTWGKAMGISIHGGKRNSDFFLKKGIFKLNTNIRYRFLVALSVCTTWTYSGYVPGGV